MIETEGYAPPEQYKGEADVRGDVYALGATLHHLAMRSDPLGEIPFTFAQRPPRSLNPRLSPEFDAVILNAVSYDPVRRYGSIDEILEAFVDLGSNGAPQVGGTVAAPQRLPSAGSSLLAVTDSIPPQTESLDTGNERLDWVFTTQDEVRGSSSIAGGAVYVGSYDGNLYALDETDGSVRGSTGVTAGSSRVHSSQRIW